MTTGISSKASDGNAVTVSLTSTVVKNQVAYANSWLGITAAAGDSGEDVALNLAGEYEVTVPSGLAVAKGDIVRIDTTHVTGHTPDNDTSAYNKNAASATNLTLGKATKAKDSNNVVTLILAVTGGII